MKVVLRFYLILACLSGLSALGSNTPAGSVVWWGHDVFWTRSYSEHTNGVLESGNEILSNVVSVAAGVSHALVLKSDGTVGVFGPTLYEGGNVPQGLSNVVSVAVEGGSSWAIRGDGTVARWGSDPDYVNIVEGLSNVTEVVWAEYRSYLALTDNGTVVGFRFDTTYPGIDSAIDPVTGLPRPPGYSFVRLVTVSGKILTNVNALASAAGNPVALKEDGSVVSLSNRLPEKLAKEIMAIPSEQAKLAYDFVRRYADPPHHYAFAVPVVIDGKALTDIQTLAGGPTHIMALRSNGTVVAWGMNNFGQTDVPAGLSNVTAIAAGGHFSLALKRDGTVACWGGIDERLTSVPPGLSNVVAIAAGDMIGLAVTTNGIPESVYVYPHGRLEEMEREAGLIFKGRVISSQAVTNDSFPSWSKTHATQFRLISVLKGEVQTNAPIFWHNTSGPMAWGGGSMPSWHQFEIGQSYLIFAAGLDKPEYTYTVPPDALERTNEFRQLYRDGVTRTLDDRPVEARPIKEAHWQELSLLLSDGTPQINFTRLTLWIT